MIHDKHVWIAEAFFTPTEIDSILAIANKKEWDEGRIGFEHTNDPARENADTGAVNNEI